MNGIEKGQPLTLSVFDRLIDDNPDSARDPAPARAQTLTDLRNAIRRDLEDLLNTRRRVVGWPDDLTELESSVLNYGVPDILAENLATETRRREVVAQMEAAIRRWEPRFVRLSVSLLENSDQTDRTLRFRIEAMIRADPAPEPLVFDSVVDPTSNVVSVTSKTRG